MFDHVPSAKITRVQAGFLVEYTKPRSGVYTRMYKGWSEACAFVEGYLGVTPDDEAEWVCNQCGGIGGHQEGCTGSRAEQAIIQAGEKL